MGKKKQTHKKPLKITLKFYTVPNDAVDCRCQCFWFCRDTDEAQLDPSMLHVLGSQAGFLECLLLPELAGAAVPYGRGARVPARGIHREHTAHIPWLLGELPDLQSFRLVGKTGVMIFSLSVSFSFEFEDNNLKNILNTHCVYTQVLDLHVGAFYGFEE